MEVALAARLRNRLLERRRTPKDLGRHRSRRAAQDDPLHADSRGNPALLPCRRCPPSALFRRGIRAQESLWRANRPAVDPHPADVRLHRSEEHPSEIQSPCNLVCRLLLEKKKTSRTVTRDAPARRAHTDVLRPPAVE